MSELEREEVIRLVRGMSEAEQLLVCKELSPEVMLRELEARFIDLEQKIHKVADLLK